MSRTRPLFRSLFWRFALASAVPMVVMALMMVAWLRPTVERDVISENETLARAVGSQVDLFLRSPLALMKSLLADGAPARPGGWIPGEAELDRVVAASPLFEALYIVGPTNRVVRVGLPLDRHAYRADYIGLDMSRRDFVATARRTGNPAWSATFLSVVSAKVSLALGLAFGDLVLVGEFNIDRLSRFVGQLHVPARILPIVIDRDAKIIAHPRAEVGGQQVSVANLDLVRRALHGEHSTRRFAFEGEAYIGSAVPVSGPGWAVLVAQPVSAAFHEFGIGVVILASGVIGALVMTLVVAFVLARRFAEPIEMLAHQTGSIGGGLFRAEIPRTSISEIKALAEGFRRMAQALKDRETRLIASERKYREIFDASNEAIFIHDADSGRIVDSNETVQFMYGLSRQEALDTAVESLAYGDPDALRERAKALLAAAAAGEPQIVEMLARHRNGAPFPVEIALKAVEIDGQPRVMAVVHDISERKQALERIRESEASLAEAQRIAHIGSWTHYHRNDRLLWSDETYRIFGVDPATLSPTPEAMLALVHPDDRARVRTGLSQSLINRAPFELSHRLLLGDGKVKYVIQRGENRYDDDGHVLQTLGVIHDISERAVAERELRQLRNYLSNVINSMPSLLVGVDAEGIVTQWNRQAERESGVPARAAAGRPLAEVFPRMAPELARVERAIATRQVQEVKKVERHIDNAVRYENVLVYPLISNGVEGAVIRIDDMTEQVRLEEIMVQSEKMLSVGGLAAGMAHEINNPLAGILQNTQVIVQRLRPEPPRNRDAAEKSGTTMDAIADYLERRAIPGMLDAIVESGRRAARIVENMLGFARQSDSRFHAYDIGELLDKSVELARNDYDLKKQYDFRKIAIVRDFQPGLPPVPCEAIKIQQVFLNLLKNGAQAMAANPADRPPRFVLRGRRLGDQVLVEIEDNGPGMEEAVRRRIFEPFYTTKPVGEGTGLGLSVSYFIVTENHKGRLAVDSSPGNGARFTVALPVAESMTARGGGARGAGVDRTPRAE